MPKSAKSPELGLFKVNLLIQKGQQVKLHFKLVKWLLSSGRYIVAFVELVVIGAFIIRYKLDTDLIDLQEKIKEQAAYINSLKSDEAIIRQTQFRLGTVKQVRTENPDLSPLLAKLALLTPKPVTLTNIALDRTHQAASPATISITGQSPSNLELSAFLKALQKDPTFSKISLANISFEGNIVFTVTGIIASPAERSN